MIPELRITRVVASMCGPLPDPRAISALARLARQLNAGLTGLLLEDATIAAIRELPFAREYIQVSNHWLSFDSLHHINEGRSARRLAQELLRKAAELEGMSTSLEFDTGALSNANVKDTDIFALFPPERAGEALLLPFSGLFTSALQLVSSALIVPPQGIRTDRPVLAIATSAEDPSINVARSIITASEGQFLIACKIDAFKSLQQKFAADPVEIIPLEAFEIDDLQQAISILKPGLVIIQKSAAMQISQTLWFRLATRDCIATLLRADKPEYPEIASGSAQQTDIAR